MNNETLRDKLCSVWSSRQEKMLTMRVYFQVEEDQGCRVFQVDRVEPVA